MIYLLTAIGWTPGDSSTVNIYTHTTHRTIQLTTRTTQLTTRNAINNKNNISFPFNLLVFISCASKQYESAKLIGNSLLDTLDDLCCWMLLAVATHTLIFKVYPSALIKINIRELLQVAAAIVFVYTQ
jgi:hypothetical protein